MCAWRRSLRWAAVTMRVLHQAAATEPRNAWVMLTLTQKNVPTEELPAEVDRILKAWTRLARRKELGSVVGWLRTLEVTHNAEENTWHPHVHALLWVRPDYWSRGYVAQQRWRELWADVLNLDYIPVGIDVHRVKKRGKQDGMDEAAQEVSKYTVKDSDLLGNEDEEDEEDDSRDAAAEQALDERVAVLDEALRSRRLIAWGGALKKIKQNLEQLDEDDEDDLVHITSEDHGKDCPVCGTEMKERVYHWIHQRKRYIG